MTGSAEFRERVIGEVRRTMIDKGWSNAALADAAGVDAGTVGDFLNGVRWPRSRTLNRIAGALEVPYAELERVGRGDDQAPRAVSPDDLEMFGKTSLLAGVNTESATEMQVALNLLTPMYHEAQRAAAAAEVEADAARRRRIERRAAVALLEHRIAAIEEALAALTSRQQYDLAALDNPQPMTDPEDDDDHVA